MKTINSLLFLLAISLITLSCNTVQGGNSEAKQSAAKAKNIILLIGDGMGLSQVSASFYFQESTNFTRFNNIGLINTSSSSDKITDSAAGATAFACGEKTYNGAIGVSKDTVNIANIVELLSKKGYKTGVISSSEITHATPASFYAHAVSRGMQDEIGAQLLKSDIDFFAGGGTDFYINRKDGINYLDSFPTYGFAVDTSSIDSPANLDSEKKYGWLLAPDGMPKMTEGRGEFLPKASEKALSFLSENDNEFFLMIEGSQIDWGGHANNAEYIITEMADFDQAIGKALDFADKDGETLVVVLSDHETGGFALSASKSNRNSDYKEIEPTFATKGHTATLIPVFAYGPGSEFFKGIYENTDIFEKMLKSLGTE